MADIKLNFSSQWASIQVYRVVASPHFEGEAASYPYIKKIPHDLGYPPLCIGMGLANGSSSYNIMDGVSVDENYVYVKDYALIGQPTLQCLVIYSIDISQPFEYPYYESSIGTVLEDTSGGTLDMRDFLLHSRAVSPMVLSVVTKDFVGVSDTLTYTSPLSYPTFSFGYIRIDSDGIWINAPLAAQAYPWLRTDGYTSILSGASPNSGSIIVLRNPEIITNNSVAVTV